MKGMKAKMVKVIELEKLLSDFDTYEEFLKYIVVWLSEHGGIFTEKELSAFEWLVAYSSTNPGVCHASFETIHYGIHSYLDGHIEKSAFDSMINKAINSGILTVFVSRRIYESNGYHIYKFNKILKCLAPPEFCRIAERIEIEKF